MQPSLLSALRRIRWQQWSALWLSLALGGMLVALLFAALRPGAAVAAGAPAEAAVFSCDQIGLNNALLAGGSATFSCTLPTTVPISVVKVVAKNVTLDGGNKLILSGGNMTGVFTVAAGVHLNLINLTLRDASQFIGAAVYNNGFLAVTHTQFISNVAGLGAAVFNAPGASATISSSTIASSNGKGGAVWNGAVDFSNQVPATLTIASTVFISNSAGDGAAIFNQAGPVIVSGSAFTNNTASSGGAIVNFASLQVDNSQFFFNRAGIVLDSQVQAIGQAAGLGLPAGVLAPSVGGAIYASPGAVSSISTSSFSDNLAGAGGGAIFYGFPPPAVVAPLPGVLSIANSTFFDNCTGGPGGALGSSLTTTVSNSSFSNNFADSSASPCILWAANQLNLPALSAPGGGPLLPPPSSLNGAGGAIFNSGVLAVDGSSFLQNEATVTTTGGGGAISNYPSAGLPSAVLTVGNSTFNNNTAFQDGGALFNDGVALATVWGSAFTRNTANNDSGGAVASLGVLTVTYSTFTLNTGAPALGQLRGGGGAIYSYNGPLLALAHANGANGANSRPATPRAPDVPGLSNRLFVDHVTFISNSSEYEGGALDAGVTAINASTFSGNTAAFGGALDVLVNDIVVSGSTFSANAVVTTTRYPAWEGGAIDTNFNAIRVINSTFYGNAVPAGARGGQLGQDGEGGAIQVQGGAMAITNSTFLSNTAGDAGQGGAFAHDVNLIAHNLLIAFNAGGNCQTTMTLTVHDLDYPQSCGASALHVDPRALAPADNGGPTLTSALLPNSPAINAGDNATCPSTDQRGAPRPVGGACDIGAFEFGGLVPRLWLPLVRR